MSEQKSRGQKLFEACLNYDNVSSEGVWAKLNPLTQQRYAEIETAVLSRQQAAPVGVLSDLQLYRLADSAREIYRNEPGDEVDKMRAATRAILAHAPAAQPAAPSTPLALSDEARESLANKADEVWRLANGMPAESRYAAYKYLLDEIPVRLSPAPVVPAYFETAKRLPTAEDGESVQAWVSNTKPPGWYRRTPGQIISHPQVYTHWGYNLPDPAPQRTAEDEALSQIDSRLYSKFQDGNISVRQIIAEVWKSRGEFDAAQKAPQP